VRKMKKWISKIKGRTFSVLGAFVEDLLKDLGDAVWDSTWEVLEDAIIKAEKKWDNGELIGERKEFVLNTVINYIQSQGYLGWIQGWMVRSFLSKAIDQVVAQLNDRLGHDWVKYTEDFRDDIEDQIDWLDEADSDNERAKGK